MKCPLNADMPIKKTFSIGFVALLLLSLVMVIFLPVNAEHPAQTIWVEPASNYFKLSESFTVDVKINITDPDGSGPATGLFGFEYKLKWSSTILNCTSYTKCDPVADLGWGIYFEAVDSLTAGQHWYAVSALVGPSTTPFTGIVTLATYTFHVTAKGNCTLDLYETEFTDDTATIIISDTIPTGTTVDSYFSTPYPRALFTYSPEFPLVNETVTFDAGDSYDPDGTIVSYAWDFGDDTTDTGVIVNHNYTAAGTYAVNLTVTDDDALTSSTSVLITVLEKPLASFTWSPEEPEVGETVTFDASVSSDRDGDIMIYEWNFGDGIEVSGSDPITTKTYTIGTYNVTLTVTDDDSLTDVITKLITVVKASSIISISVSPETIKVGEDTVISGSITPAREDANVTIHHRLTGGVAWNTTTVTTSSTGGYSYTWTPDEAGTYEVKASWPGDDNNLGAESSIKTVTVEEEAAPPPDYLLYVVIVIVIVILAAIVIYFLKIRKS